MTIARLAADLRATGSIRGTTTDNVVASGKPIPPATQQRLSELNGAVNAICARIELALGMMDPSAKLKTKVDDTKERYEERRVREECVSTRRSRWLWSH